MNKNKKNIGQEDKLIVPRPATTRKTFSEIKREFEAAYASDRDHTRELLELATAITCSCLNTCLDPQRISAQERGTVSDNGISPVIDALKRGMLQDILLLEHTADVANHATRIVFGTDGDPAIVTADPEARIAFGKLIRETLSDGLDLRNTAVLAILEQASEHATCPNWLDTPYTVRRLSKRVYIQVSDSAAYRDDVTTPVQEVYRQVRAAVQSSCAVQTDPRNGYTYIEDMTPDGLDVIFYRLQKWADIGGYDCHGLYTADLTSMRAYHNILKALNLTRRQLDIVQLRMRGYGYKAIASYLGVNEASIKKQLYRLRDKCKKFGITPTTRGYGITDTADVDTTDTNDVDTTDDVDDLETWGTTKTARPTKNNKGQSPKTNDENK